MSDKKGIGLKIAGYTVDLLSVLVWFIGANISQAYAVGEPIGLRSPEEVAASVLNGFVFLGVLLAIAGTLFVALGMIVEKLSVIADNTCSATKKPVTKNKDIERIENEKAKQEDMEKAKREAEESARMEEQERILREAEERVMREAEENTKVDYERISKIEKLRVQGLITEEEYQQAISKVQ